MLGSMNNFEITPDSCDSGDEKKNSDFYDNFKETNGSYAIDRGRTELVFGNEAEPSSIPATRDNALSRRVQKFVE